MQTPTNAMMEQMRIEFEEEYDRWHRYAKNPSSSLSKSYAEGRADGMSYATWRLDQLRREAHETDPRA